MKRSAGVGLFVTLVAIGALVSTGGCAGRLTALKAPKLAASGSVKTPAQPAPQDQPKAVAREATRAPRMRPVPEPKKKPEAPAPAQPSAAPAPLPPQTPTAGTSGAYSVLETRQPIPAAPAPSRLASLRLALQKAGAAADGREVVFGIFLAVGALAAALLARARRRNS